MPQPESISTPVVQMPATQTVVTSIPAEKSRTLQLNKLVPIISAIAAVALTLVQFATQLLADPAIAALVAKWIPLETAWAVVGALAILGKLNWNLRLDTAQPIIGSTGEARAKGAE